jgi:hypothetical protein
MALPDDCHDVIWWEDKMELPEWWSIHITTRSNRRSGRKKNTLSNGRWGCGFEVRTKLEQRK